MTNHGGGLGRVRALGQALADGGRLRVLLALRGRELCACEIMALLGLAAATVSRHMAILQAAGLVTARKAGRWVHYRLATPAPAAELLKWLDQELAADPQIQADQEALGRQASCTAATRVAARRIAALNDKE
ncbi:MAG: metalloregulator ArsR/SmtB family transcription factor [Lentisphaeria bacterium]